MRFPFKGKKKKGGDRRRKAARIAAFSLTAFMIIWGWLGVWFVHHPREWIADACRRCPGFIVKPLMWIGNPVSDVTDALDLTGEDAIVRYDRPPPAGSVFFAGAPRRTAFPAARDIKIIDRGDFVIGWSDSLRHPVWCAYHVTKDALYENSKRPGFTKDREHKAAPSPAAYTHSGYDRGHMAPNYAIVTRYGAEAQKLTFRMSNISPQTPQLNRGVWRDLEHRIADFWTSRYGEIWVIVGCISRPGTGRTINGYIDIPTHYYQIIVAQEGEEVRALATIFPQNIPWRAWAARNIITIDELEKLTGFDFLAELPAHVQDPHEAALPSRMWPVIKRDIFKLIGLRFR